jgi:recombination protein RecA
VSIVEDINKKFGSGSIYMMGEKTREDLEAFSTGIIGLDHALGVGGFARGRISEIYSESGLGKCLSEDNYVLTAEHGYQTVGEIFKLNELEPFCITKTVEKTFGLVNRDGNVEDTTFFTFNGRRPVYKITTESGVVIKSTANHPHLVIDENGFLVWKRTNLLDEEDFLCLARNKKHFGNVSVDADEAYLLGVLVADGCMSSENKISITNDDPYIKDLVESKFCDIFNFSRIRKYDNNDKDSITYDFSDKKAISAFFAKYGMAVALSKDKKLSSYIRSFDENSMRHFLRGFSECEAYFGSDSLEIVSASYELAYQLKLALSQFGIITCLTKKYVNKYPDNSYYRLTVTGKNYEKYVDDIGFSSQVKKSQYMNYHGDTVHKYGLDTIPNLGRLIASLSNSTQTAQEMQKLITGYRGSSTAPSHKKLQQFIELAPEGAIRTALCEVFDAGYYYDRIVSVELQEAVPTFDFTLDSTHSFIVSGAVTHNTSICLMAIADAQRKGLKAAIVDAEHALDINVAEMLGVDVDNLLISQPDNGPQALEITDMLITSGQFGLVVVDSVAALVPIQETSETFSYGDAVVAVHARLMSQAMRRLTPLVAKHNTALIFTNQIRATIQSFGYGDNTVTTGGMALKFFSSQRIELKRLQQVKVGDEIVGHKVKAKVVKNKVGTPYKEYTYTITYGENGVKYNELVELGVEYGLIKKGGAWFSYGEGKWQGTEKLKDALKNNAEMYNELHAAVLEKLSEGK